MALTDADLAQIQAMIDGSSMVGDGFPDSIVAGQNLVIPGIQSPNFSLASHTGWQILKSGLATFFNLVVTGGTITGPDYVINPAGIFIYSGTPAPGNLIGSWAGVAGTDGFGNTFPQGLSVTVGTISGSSFSLTGAATITGPFFIFNTNGQFYYDGTPAAGNMVGSFAEVAGTDSFGNSYPAGINVTVGTINGLLTGFFTGSISNSAIGSTAISGSDYQGGTMEETTITFDSGGGHLLVYAMTSVISTVSVSGTFGPVPAGITSLNVMNWGGGDSGWNGTFSQGGPGGCGGEYAAEPDLAVTPGNSYPYTVGTGGASTPGTSGGIQLTNPGGNTTFAGDVVTVLAHGGRNNFDLGQTSTNTVHFDGGIRGNPNFSVQSRGGAGGSSASPLGAGANGQFGSGTTGGNGGVGPAGSGSRGKGGNGTGTTGTPGVNATAPGGGGGGGGGGSASGSASGTGAAGQIRITYISARTLIAAVSAVAGTAADGSAYPVGMMSNTLQLRSTGGPPATPATGNPILYADANQPAYVGPSGQALHLSGGKLATAVTLTALGVQIAAVNIATITIPANDAIAGAIYKITAMGNAAWASAVQILNLQCTLGGISLGGLQIAAAAFAATASLRWKMDVYAVCVTAGSPGAWFGGLSGSVNETGNPIAPGTAATNSVAVSAAIAATAAGATTGALTLALQAWWQVAPTSGNFTPVTAFFERIA